MKVVFESSFARDLKRIKDKSLLLQIQETIDAVKAADVLNDVHHLKKMQGYETFYRIRLKEYRIGIEVAGNEVVFVRILHRKDIYRYFP
ncbi:MAG: type II toxin-antitoxin system RelE/ParE family toxin [Ardenticatenaceae bacterium]|nr:type II toxin-antitoxin system RelE/ParE family toxin [Ardenticatenaceae bacterium]